MPFELVKKEEVVKSGLDNFRKELKDLYNDHLKDLYFNVWSGDPVEVSVSASKDIDAELLESFAKDVIELADKYLTETKCLKIQWNVDDPEVQKVIYTYNRTEVE